MIDNPLQEGTSEVNRSGRRHRVKVSADGRGVVSHAGTALLRELATETGLAGAVSGALLDTYRGLPLHMPGQAFADLGEALAGLLRAGSAGSNTAADHVQLLGMALAALPAHARPRPGDPASPRVLARSDSAGATHAFAAACRTRGVEFSFGFPVDQRVQNAVGLIPPECWHPAIEDGDELREGAWVAEATGMIDLSAWPEGSRLVLRKERPHPGAQLTFT